MKSESRIFEEYLKEHGLKFTQPRRIILAAVFKTHKHFDVESLYDNIRQNHHNVSRATVYRTIPLLIESGLIKQSLRCRAKDQYEHIYGHKRHFHFICTKCGRILEVFNPRVEKEVRKMAEKEKFIIQEFNIGAKGICKDCSKKIESVESDE